MPTVIPIDELLAAPTIPPNVPPFRLITACEFAESLECESDDDSEALEEVFPCECTVADSCGPEAKCINRELFIECPRGECPCGERCQNQRFGRREYARVKVVETPGKGFGLFACEDLKAGSFIMEYVGEIVDKDEMATRSASYAAHSQPHFYFMTLRPSRLIDATRKGNISRFMNHSCAPNCETQKWIVEGRVRIGLFTIRAVKAGTELSFDYKFVRYGKEPQKCLCGEDCCTGFIGVSEDPSKKRPSRKASDLEGDLIALGALEDVEDVEDIITLLREAQECKRLSELLGVISASSDSLCLRKFLSLHGLRVLAQVAKQFKAEPDTVKACLRALKGLPISTVNGLEESGWMELLEELEGSLAEARELRQKFGGLQRVFKIPKKRTIDVEEQEQEVEAASGPAIEVPQEFSQALKKQREQDRDGRGREQIDGNSRREYQQRRDYSDHQRRDYQQGRDYTRDQRRDYTRDQGRDYNDHQRRGYPYNRDSRDQREQTSRDHLSSHSSRDYHRTSPSRSSPHRSSPNRTSNVNMIPDPMWLEACTEDGQKYYYHSVTRETSWTLPMIRDRDNPRDARDTPRDTRDTRDTTLVQSKQSHNQPTQSLLEGVQDAQLAAIIDRAKARRTQVQSTDDSSASTKNTELDIFSLLSSTTTATQSTTTTTHSKQSLARIKDEVSEVVVKFLSHYRSHFPSEEFKEAARRYTHRILEKEASSSSTGEAFEMTARKRAKIKAYLAESLRGRKIPLLPEHEILLK